MNCQAYFRFVYFCNCEKGFFVRYVMLLKPHANIRYRQSLRTLAMTELACGMKAWGLQGEPSLTELGGKPFLSFEADNLSPEAWRFLSGHSGCCLAAEWREGALYPLARGGGGYFPDELPQVLKYKGKTNADFTAMLLRCARAASAFARTEEPLTVLDPLCGKATTLFCALVEGENAVGVELDGKALHEADGYLERFLKLHHFKHQRRESGLTVAEGGSAKCVSYALSNDKESYKQGDQRTLRLINGDAAHLASFVKEGSCHLVVADLPYGVQHAPKAGGGMSTLEGLTLTVARGCARALKKGGALAFSFNAYTLRRERVIHALESAGLHPLTQAPYDGFSHWVEQAVERDAVIAVRQ